jgi:O-antigen/teichoic acid export membrane protein
VRPSLVTVTMGRRAEAVALTRFDEAATPVPPAPEDIVASDSLARNTLFATANTILLAGFAAFLTLYLVRALDPRGYGLYTLALAIGALFALVMDFGISSSAARFIAERRGDRRAIAAYIADALRLKIAIAGGVGLVLFAAAGEIADLYGKPGLTWPLRGVALALVGSSLLQLYGAALIAQARLPVGFLMTFAQSGGFLVFGVVLVSLGAGATGAAFGRAIGYAFGLAVGTVMIVRLFGRSALAIRSAKGNTRQIAAYAGALAVVEGAYLLFDQLDALLIGAYLSSAAVGLFQAPFGLTVFMHYPAGVVATSVAPRVAVHQEHGSDVGVFAHAIRLLIVGYAALLAPLVVWATPIVDLLLGSNYERSASVLRAFAPYVFLAAVGTLLSPAANYLGRARQRLPIALAAVAINLVVDVILIPRIGIVAGAIGTDLALLVYVPAHLWICASATGLDLRPLGLALVRSLAAAAAMAGVLLAFGTTDLSLLDWLLGGAASVAVYLAVLFVLRELTVDEFRVARAWVSARFG